MLNLLLFVFIAFTWSLKITQEVLLYFTFTWTFLDVLSEIYLCHRYLNLFKSLEKRRYC